MTIFTVLLATRELLRLQPHQMDTKDLSTLVIESERAYKSNGMNEHHHLSVIDVFSLLKKNKQNKQIHQEDRAMRVRAASMYLWKGRVPHKLQQ